MRKQYRTSIKYHKVKCSSYFRHLCYNDKVRSPCSTSGPKFPVLPSNEVGGGDTLRLIQIRTCPIKKFQNCLGNYLTREKQTYTHGIESHSKPTCGAHSVYAQQANKRKTTNRFLFNTLALPIICIYYKLNKKGNTQKQL